MIRSIRTVLHVVLTTTAVLTAMQPASRSVFAQETAPQWRVNSLESAHAALSKPEGNHHDAGIYLKDDGDATSVPYLVTALQWQEETKAGDRGMVCTKAHMLGALRGIVNQNAGRNYPEWKEWWEKNKEKSREEWIHDGFRIANLPVKLPPDHDYCVALIETANGPKSYLKKNALGVLAEVPDDLLEAAIGQCMDSVKKSARLAAAHCIGELRPKGTESRLRGMLEDPEEEVRQMALTRLNEILRAGLVVSATDHARWRGKLGEHVTAVASGPDASHLIVGIEKARHMGLASFLACFDMVKREIEWEYACSGVVNCAPVIRGGKVYFCTDDGRVTWLDSASGKFIWANQTEGHPGSRPTNQLVFLGEQVVVTMERSLWSFDCEDGRVLWRLDVAPLVGKLVSLPQAVATVTQDRRLIVVSATGEVIRERELAWEPAWQTGRLCADEKALYVLAGEGPAHLAAYSPADLSVLWEKEIGDKRGSGRGGPVLIPEGVVGCGSGSLVAVRRSDGGVLWSTREEVDSPIYPVGGWMLLEANGRDLELRRVKTGEVAAAIPDLRTYSRPMYVSEDTIATGDMAGNLWILNTP